MPRPRRPTLVPPQQLLTHQRLGQLLRDQKRQLGAYDEKARRSGGTYPKQRASQSARAMDRSPGHHQLAFSHSVAALADLVSSQTAPASLRNRGRDLGPLGGKRLADPPRAGIRASSSFCQRYAVARVKREYVHKATPLRGAVEAASYLALPKVMVGTPATPKLARERLVAWTVDVTLTSFLSQSKATLCLDENLASGFQ